MKKQFAAIFAATAVLGVTTAFAANPFSDVTPDSWAYQAVSQLANAGVINGYPDGTFKGQNNITRYEMAQMVAKAMANQDRANAEQQAMINRLADEFSNELNNLGVRVARLEDRVGNVKLLVMLVFVTVMLKMLNLNSTLVHVYNLTQKLTIVQML